MLADIRKLGGNESDIPKRISGLLRAKGWMETQIKGDLLITKIAKSNGKKSEPRGDAEENEDESDTLGNIEELKKKGYSIEHITRENFLDGHKVDYVKNRVAFDLDGQAAIPAQCGSAWWLPSVSSRHNTQTHNGLERI